MARLVRLNPKMIELIEQGRGVLGERIGQRVSRNIISGIYANELINARVLERLGKDQVILPVTRRKQFKVGNTEFKL